MTKQIPLTQGKFALVSDHRFEYLNQWKWFAHKNTTGKWYAERKEAGKTVFMHREIMTAPGGMQVDHRDSDGLNNTDENLRVCTNTENRRNSGKPSNNISGFKGVSWHKSSGKYAVQISVNGKHVYLGVYADPAEAAKVYDEAARKHYGEFAKTNFVIQDGTSSPEWFAAQKERSL